MPIDLRELPMIQEAMQEGREVGEKIGRQEGRHEGRQEALVAVAEEKFGSLSAAIREALLDQTKDFAQTARIVVHATSIDQLVADLAS